MAVDVPRRQRKFPTVNERMGQDLSWYEQRFPLIYGLLTTRLRFFLIWLALLFVVTGYGQYARLLAESEGLFTKQGPMIGGDFVVFRTAALVAGTSESRDCGVDRCGGEHLGFEPAVRIGHFHPCLNGTAFLVHRAADVGQLALERFVRIGADRDAGPGADSAAAVEVGRRIREVER